MNRCVCGFALFITLASGCADINDVEEPGSDSGNAATETGGMGAITLAGGNTAITGNRASANGGVGLGGIGGSGGGGGVPLTGGSPSTTGGNRFDTRVGGQTTGGNRFDTKVGGQTSNGATGATGITPGTGATGTTANTGGSGNTVTTTPGTGSVPSAVTDYGAPGPFGDAKMFTNVGPNKNYTMFRPDASLGRDGFKHPLVSWGNGITTTPQFYREMLTLVATHGFVVIATNDTTVEEAAVVAGLDWLVEQNKSGEMAGKLDVTREATVGYSWGGGASIDAANRKAVLCTVSLHGMPPRRTDAFATMHAPLLLTTSTGDEFVTASEYVTPNYEKSTVQTFYGTLGDSTAGHLYIAENNTDSALICGGGSLLGTFGSCGGATEERAPLIAWLRLWVYGEQGAKKYFFGDDCVLCKKPWTNPQRKNWK